jgi:hypothetical protein
VEEPTIGPIAAAGVLVVTTILVAICAEYLVGSIDDLVEHSGISKAFIGLILIPIVGNAAEHVTAVVVAVRNKMDLAMGVAIGSSIQIALLVTPFLVIVGWIIGQDMSLHFETCKSHKEQALFSMTGLTVFPQSKLWLLLSRFSSSPTLSRMASRITSRELCSLVSTLSSLWPSTPHRPMRSRSPAVLEWMLHTAEQSTTLHSLRIFPLTSLFNCRNLPR